MSGEYRIDAPRQAVWDALNDPEVLKACIPGCETLEQKSPTELAAQVTTKVGPVKAKFKGEVTLENLNPPESYTIAGEGKGGVAGFAKGGADVHLAEDGAGTILTYTAKAQVGGKLAQLGSRLIDSTAKKMADQFFDSFAQKVADGSSASEPVAEPLAEAEPVPEPQINKASKPSDTAAEAARRAVESSMANKSSGASKLFSSWRYPIIAAVLIIALIYILAT